MRKQTLNTLEVFKYASAQQTDTNCWNKKAIQRIEAQLINDKTLSRLSVLILRSALTYNHLDWFSDAAQKSLKTTATKLIMDVASKHHFIKQLVPLLEENDIPVILLKGMAFNHYLFDHNGPRGVSDIDILIKPEHKARFKAIFSQVASVIDIEKKYAFDDLYEQTWRSNNSLHLIDVHIHLTNPHLFDICQKDLWERSMPHPEYLTEHVRVLGREDTACHLVTHMINDTNFYHYNLIDLHELLLKKPLDAAELTSISSSWGVLNGTQIILEVVHTYLNSPRLFADKPKNILLKIRVKLALFTIDYLFTLASREKSLLHRLKQLCCYLFVVDKSSLILRISWSYFSAVIKNLKTAY